MCMWSHFREGPPCSSGPRCFPAVENSTETLSWGKTVMLICLILRINDISNNPSGKHQDVYRWTFLSSLRGAINQSWKFFSLTVSSSGFQVHMDGRDNTFRRQTSFQLLDPLVLGVVLQVPGVGRVKALALLKHFSSLQQLCNAAPSQLEPIVGQAAALLIHHFFNKPVKPVCF